VTDFYAGRRILVTGGAGFIGSSLVEHLTRERGVRATDLVVPRRDTCDLRVFDNARRAVDGCDVIFHLAAPTGGIAYSRAYPASQYYSCSLINLHVFEAARQAGVRRLVALGNLLAYPAAAASPLREEQLHEGKIAETHLGIGLSKRDLVLLAEMYHREFGLPAVVVLSANAYGPRDHFDPEKSHVIPATIVKCCAQPPELVVWGDGTPTRDFLYVDDIAAGVALAGERLAPGQYVNLASGREISIGDLVRLIAQLTGFKGAVRFDVSKGGGDPRRGASSARSDRLLRFTPRVSLEEGLRRTVAWYRAQA
jgi:GDP-L-fucose synthase